MSGIVIKARKTNEARIKWGIIGMGISISGDFYEHMNLIRKSAFKGAKWQ